MQNAQTRASAKYNAKTYEEIKIRVYKGQKDQIAAHAASKGMSLNAYINALIAADMGEKLTRPKQEQGE